MKHPSFDRSLKCFHNLKTFMGNVMYQPLVTLLLCTQNSKCLRKADSLDCGLSGGVFIQYPHSIKAIVPSLFQGLREKQAEGGWSPTTAGAVTCLPTKQTNESRRNLMLMCSRKRLPHRKGWNHGAISEVARCLTNSTVVPCSLIILLIFEGIALPHNIHVSSKQWNRFLRKCKAF